MIRARSTLPVQVNQKGHTRLAQARAASLEPMEVSVNAIQLLCLFRSLKPIRCLKLWIILPSTYLGALKFSQKVYLCMTSVV